MKSALLLAIGLVGVAVTSRTSPEVTLTATAKDIIGATVTIPAKGAKATVIAFTGTTCPIAQKLGPTLAALEDTYAKKGVKFIFVNPSTTEDVPEMKEQIKRLKLNGHYVHDPESILVQKTGAKTTTEVFVLNSKGSVIYRGALNDQYAIGAVKPAPKNHYLRDALDSLLAGKTPKVKQTEAPGCVLSLPEPKAATSITYHGRVEAIIQEKCVSCHRDGGVAPFKLDTFQDVKGRAPMIEFVLKQGIMPPWFAHDSGAKESPWLNDMSMTAEQKETIYAWIKEGMAQGDPSDAPKPRAFVPGWIIGKPDQTFKIPAPISVPATGVMAYQNRDVPTNLTEDKWVQAIEVKPSDRSVVHHVLVFVRQPGTKAPQAGSVEEALEELSGFFGAYVPGNSSLVYSNGLAKRLPKGSVLRFQIHYTPNGKATEDQTEIGLIYAKTPPQSEVHTASLANLRFAIPPGAPNHPVTARLRIPADVQVLSYLPHMHLRGKAARYELVDQAGKKTTLLDVPNYDFNWQLNYVYKQPKTLRKGDELIYTAWYDNSEENHANPDPTRTVTWGAQTFDEMHLGYLEYIVPGEKPGEGSQSLRRASAAAAVGENGVKAIFERLDRDKDGFVSETEAGALWTRVKVADTNKDGKISLEEAFAAFGR